MKCKSVRRNLSLYIGGDLTQNKKLRVDAHIQSCEECHHEFTVYKESVSAAKAWVKQDYTEWQEDTWMQSVKLAIQTKPASQGSLWPWPYKPVWAYAMMITILIVFSVFLLKPFPFGEELLSPTEMALTPQQDIVAVTLVSKESGLQVQWFFNKNYNLEEEIE